MFCSYASAQDSLVIAKRDSINRLAQDPDFIKVSLLTASPGKALYSIHGHSFLRLQSPSNNLDIAYTFEINNTFGNVLRYIHGTSEGGFVFSPIENIIEQYRSEGRGVVEQQLNLSPHQEQELWKYLDNELLHRNLYRCDHFCNSCTQMAENAIQSVMGDEQIVYKLSEEIRCYMPDNERQILVGLLEDFPWHWFFWNITIGEIDNKEDIFFGRIAPRPLATAWQNASIRDKDGNLRPMTSGEPHELLAATLDNSPFPITPLAVSVGLLLITVLSIWTDLKRKFSWLGKSIDTVLVAIHAVISLWVTYLLFFSSMSATSWNWLFVVFNPAFELCRLLLRRKAAMRYVYATTALVALGMCLCYPLLPQLQASPALAALMLAFSARSIIHFKQQ